MKNISLISLILLFIGNLYSQSGNPKVTASPKYKHEQTFNFNHVILNELDDESSILIQPKKKSFSISKYGDNAIKKEVVDLSLDKNQEYYDSYFSGNGKDYVIIKEHSKSNTRLYVRKLNLTTNQFESDLKELYTSENEISAGFVKLKDEKCFRFYVADNKPVNGSRFQYERSYIIFDEDFKQISKLEIPNVQNKMIEFSAIKFVNNKTVCIVAYGSKNEDSFILRKPISQINIKAFVYKETGELEKKLEVESNQNYYIGNFSSEVVENSLKFIASYSDSKNGLVKGFACFSIDLDANSNPKIQYDEIGEELMCKYAGFNKEVDAIKKSYKSDKNCTKYNYWIKKVIPHNNGYYAVMQQEGAAFIDGKAINHQEIWYRDFIIASYNKNNEVEWIKKAPVISKQIILRDWAWEYIVKDDCLIIVHPHLNNKFRKEVDSEEDKGVAGNFLVMQKLEKDGNLSREIVFDLKKELKIAQFASYSDSDNSNSMSFLGYTRNQYHIIRVDFENK